MHKKNKVWYDRWWGKVIRIPVFICVGIGGAVVAGIILIFQAITKDWNLYED